MTGSRYTGRGRGTRAALSAERNQGGTLAVLGRKGQGARRYRRDVPSAAGHVGRATAKASREVRERRGKVGRPPFT